MQTKNSFFRLLGAQLRVLFNRTGFQLAWLLMLIFSLSAVFGKFYFNFNSVVTWLSSVADNFLFGDHASARDMFFFFMPIVCALAFADSTVEEKDSGLLPALLVRRSKAQYYFAKMLTCMIAAVLVVAVPLLINLALNAIVYPTPFESSIWPEGGGVGQRWFYTLSNEMWTDMPMKSLYLQNVYLYLLAIIGMTGLYAAVGAAFAYAASYFFKYRVLVLLPLFLLQEILGLLSSFTVQRWNITLDITDYLRVIASSYVHIPVFFIIMVCIALVTVLLVPYGLKKLRNVY